MNVVAMLGQVDLRYAGDPGREIVGELLEGAGAVEPRPQGLDVARDGLSGEGPGEGEVLELDAEGCQDAILDEGAQSGAAGNPKKSFTPNAPSVRDTGRGHAQ